MSDESRVGWTMLTLVAVVVGLLVWNAPDADDAMAAVEAERERPSVHAIQRERNLRYEAEKRAERAELVANRMMLELYARGVLVLPTIEVERKR